MSLTTTLEESKEDLQKRALWTTYRYLNKTSPEIRLGSRTAGSLSREAHLFKPHILEMLKDERARTEKKENCMRWQSACAKVPTELRWHHDPGHSSSSSTRPRDTTNDHRRETCPHLLRQSFVPLFLRLIHTEVALCPVALCCGSRMLRPMVSNASYSCRTL